ncbi:MAG: protein-export chaperone SecB [bacterium]|nr:protein-export chaperone SecB [bacterium]MDE0239502.1 protein-export chaperone SecB [bacterium]MDE0417263.1 protein-export chaperone SecB [bacterium]
MAEETAAAERVQAKLRLHTQFLQDLSFESPRGAASIAAAADNKPEIEVNLNIDSRQLQEDFYEVALRITVNATRDEEPWFLVELDYRGVFSLADVDDKARAPLLLIEGPRMIFPFARRIIADVVRDGGFPPLLMEPVDFLGLYRQHALARQEKDKEAESD